MHPLLGASSFYWNCKHGFVTAEVRVGTATIIDFGKQSRITCLPGRGAYWNCKQGWLCPSLAVLFRHLLRQIVLTEPLRITCFYGCREYGWKNQSGADNDIFFRSGRFSLWHFRKHHSWDLFLQINSCILWPRPEPNLKIFTIPDIVTWM